jgi:twitching motility protein PilU
MEREQSLKFMHDLLRALIARKGSDLFITAGFPPAMKVDGKVTPVSQQSLSPVHTQELARSIMTDKQAAEFEATNECNFAIAIGHQSLPRERIRAAKGPAGRCCTIDTIEVRRPWAFPHVRKDRDDQAGTRDLRGRHGLGQVHVARRVGHRNEEQLRPHHHHPGSVNTSTSTRRHHPQRSGKLHLFEVPCPEEHAAGRRT